MNGICSSVKVCIGVTFSVVFFSSNRLILNRAILCNEANILAAVDGREISFRQLPTSDRNRRSISLIGLSDVYSFATYKLMFNIQHACKDQPTLCSPKRVPVIKMHAWRPKNLTQVVSCTKM